jgi:hypothetical protein
MLVPANAGFQEENSTPDGLERVISAACRECRVSGSEMG